MKTINENNQNVKTDPYDQNIASLTQEQRSASNTLEVPSISLPKGGGALKGIDEKFKVNPSNGTSSIQISLPLTPGRNGLSPSFSLSYNSGNGNSIFGLGWSLNYTFIQRKTDRKLPRYLQDSEDTFIINGAEDLVPYLKKNSAGKYLSVEQKVGDYTIKRYRPRIEGAFDRIEKIHHKILGVYWKVTTPNNVTTIYGRDQSSRIANPENGSQIFKWLPEFTYDDKGNWILYKYKKEDLINVPENLHEKNRIKGIARFTNSYLKSVKYGNRVAYYADVSKPYDPPTPSNQECFFELVLDYGDHNLLAPKPNDTGKWFYRSDAFSSYRSGFEIRTNRLCKRILMFHHFKDEKQFVGTPEEETFGENYLVRSVDLVYAPSSINNSSETDVNYLSSASQSGYIRKPDGTYSKKTLPSMEFTYQDHSWNQTIKTVSKENIVNAPTGLTNNYQLIDLYGEGVSGILAEEANGWFYKSNLGDSNETGEVGFSIAKKISSRPSFSGITTGLLTIQDLEANGEKQIVIKAQGLYGYFELLNEDNWKSFEPFEQKANIDLQDPNTRLIDLNGDGKPELVITEENALVWYPSNGKKGYVAAEFTKKLFDEDRGPAVVFADAGQTIFLADMVGDGLTDIVRIRNNEVCYWANMGYGKFSSKITMSNPPDFDSPDAFNPSYLQIADISGTGTADIIYLGKNRFTAYLNLSGNAWSNAHQITSFFPVHQNSKISIVDLFGNGTSCIVWSSDLPDDAQKPMRYIDLMKGKKPHILTHYKNNLGKETTINYKSSTHFYLKDKREGTPWVTKLPFPVQVVSKTITKEKIADVRFTTSYSYHHGYFDYTEREFRGFGRVDQIDTEEYPEWSRNNATNSFEKKETLFQKPVLTRTWFHTGAFLENDLMITYFKREYWFEEYNRKFPESPLAVTEPVLPDAQIEDEIKTLSEAEFQEAMRACKGMMLRQEVFALDAPENATKTQLQLQSKPFTVATHNCNIQLVQPRQSNEFGVFLVTESQAINLTYERDESDYRLTHTIHTEIDDLGNTLESAFIVYGRDPIKANNDFFSMASNVSDFTEEVISGDPAEQVVLQNAFSSNITAAKNEQTKTHIIFSKNSFTKYRSGTTVQDDIDLPHAYRLRQPYETKTYELTGLSPSGAQFQFSEVKNVLSSATVIEYQNSPSSGIQKRLIEHSRSLYRKDDLSKHDPGFFDTLGLLYESYQLAFTPTLITHLYSKQDGTELQVSGNPLSSIIESEGKFTKIDGNLWIRSGIVHLKANSAENLANVKSRFYTPLTYEDSFGSLTKVIYDTETFNGTSRYNDGYYLFVKEIEDAVGNKLSIDTYNYRTLSPNRVIDINANANSVLLDELGLVKALAGEGNGYKQNNSVLKIDKADDLEGLKEYQNSAENALIKQFLGAATKSSTDTTLLKSTGKDLLKHASARFVYDFESYSTSAFPAVAASITREEHYHINNNSSIQFGFEYSGGMGNVLMTKVQVEPGDAYYIKDGVKLKKNTGTDLRWIGNGRTVLNNKGNPVKQYEPYFSTNFLYENNAELVEIGVTPVLHYDSLGRQVYTQFPDGSLSRIIFDSWKKSVFDQNDTALDKNCEWYKRRTDNSRSDFINDLKEQQAAQKTAVHAATPTSLYYDSLGRPVLSITHNGRDTNAKDRLYTTFIDLDIEGNAKAVVDSRGNQVVTYKYNMLGHRLYQKSMDAGERWTLNNSMGNPVILWDSKDQVFKTKYDALQRPVESLLGHVVIGKLIYGENVADDQKNNLRGKVFEQYDSSGKTQNTAFDFKGNLLTTTRQLAAAFDQAVIDWSPGSSTNVLENQVFTKQTSFDALNRMQRMLNWHRSTANVTVYIPSYNERGSLVSETHVTGADKTNLTGTGRSVLAVSHIEFNEKGQRTRIRYGNGTTTKYHYDPLTFRLVQMKTTKDGVAFNLPAAPSNLNDSNVLQNLYYTYDASGNILEIEDDAFETVFFMNQQVDAKNEYTYDALYRLIAASGRENKSFNNAPASTEPSATAVNFPITSNTTTDKTLRNYTQKYNYDPVGNMLRIRHISPIATDRWTRNYEYASDSNHLLRSYTGSNPTPSSTVNYNYDAHGNMLNYNDTPQAYLANWDYLDRVHKLNLGGGGEAHYQYDGQRQRTRKYIAKSGITEERIYLGGTELYRRRNASNAVVEEIETHHLYVEDQRILIVENILETDNNQLNKGILDRYQYSNHLGSVGLETDGSGVIISYEEYHPYGSVAYKASNASVKATKKRYRYTGMERDEESGLNYHGARYYLPWLGRWMSVDPIGIGDGLNVYKYCNSSPIRFSDKNGEDAFDEAAPILESIRSTTSGHGFYRGTFEAVLGEAQGLNIVRQPSAGGGRAGASAIYNHASQLRSSVQASRNRLTEIGEFLQRVSRTDPDAHRHLSRVFDPLQQQLRSHVQMGEQTLDLARQLRTLHPNRLSAFTHVSRGRTVNSLISRQLAETGIPHSLVPPGLIDNGEGRRLMSAINSAPLDGGGSSRAARTAIGGLDEVADAARTAARSGTRASRDVAESFSRRLSRRVGHILPGALSAFSAAMLVSDVAEAQTNEERGRVMARASGGEAGGEGGFWLGCAGAAAIFSETGPGAGIACVIGGVIGGFTLGWAGEEAGEAAFDAGWDAANNPSSSSSNRRYQTHIDGTVEDSQTGRTWILHAQP
ncbi:SpvB/TcaC N-terminal domain-containing protein [Flavobacteriaceae bacterium M23B6Z8]